MTPDATQPETSPPPSAGENLQRRVEEVGLQLANALNLVIASLPDRPSGPRALGRAVGMTTVSASRLLKAIGCTNPIAVVQSIPGPNPLSGMLDGAERALGGPTDEVEGARTAVAAFEALIKEETGDRGSLRAMLSAWLPEERREFEAQRRQTIFKALAELDGVSCDLELSTIVLVPSEKEGWLDIVNAKCLLGIDRMRPDAAVRLGTWRLGNGRDDEDGDDGTERPRVPLNLDGEPALDGIHTVRLDEFCSARPAPVIAKSMDDLVQYELGPTGFGRNSKVDVVIGEVNRAELRYSPPEDEKMPYFFMIPEMPTRRAVLDVIVHRDVYPGAVPEVVCHDSSSLGPAMPTNPAREPDRRPFYEPVETLGHGVLGARLIEFPRYSALLQSMADRLDFDLEDFAIHRVAVSYALPNRQLSLLFRAP